MPPKKVTGNEPSKKTDQKKKEKVIEDKTFGLKNKKGAKQQRFIKTVAHQVQHGNQSLRKLGDPLEDKNKKKLDKKKEQDELNALFRPIAQVAGKGVDPKSVLCAFYKQGQCGKGDKCKFSHDLNINRKAEKRNIYEDVRDDDTMENWDEAKLEEVVNSKHGASEESKPQTAIICKHFLEAVENNKYGWFWECPSSGNKCIYRHALPPGFVLKKDVKKDDKENQISIEDLVEKERAALGGKTTRVTLESFLRWKERKRKEKDSKAKQDKDKKKAEYTAGKISGISGREMFEFNPDLILDEDDEEGGAVMVFEHDSEADDGEVHEINLDDFAYYAQESDGTGTISQSDNRLGDTSTAEPAYGTTMVNGGDEADKLSEAAALPAGLSIEHGAGDDGDGATAMVNGDIGSDIQIDEDLFDGEDLDQIDDDLDTMDLSD